MYVVDGKICHMALAFAFHNAELLLADMRPAC
jgi:hypothetical protein